MQREPTKDGFSSATTAGSQEAPALHERHAAWIEARGISAELARKLGLCTVERSGAKWLAVPYVQRGKTINHKYRLTSEKRHMMDPDAPLALWNHDCLLEASSQPLVICEGEWDAMVALQLGWRAVSVPNGAPKEQSDDPANERRYDCLWQARDLLNRVDRVILAVDDDGPGRALRADLIALLGADRCSFVEYPFPAKDLNEVLTEYGPEAANAALLNAKAVPVKGLYSLSDFPDMPKVQGFPVGIDALEGKIEIVPGTLTVFTGYANMGKSSVMNTVCAHAIAHDMTVCIGSFETLPKPILRDGIAQALIGCSWHEYGSHPQRRAAFDTIEEHVRIVTNTLDEDMELDITALLDLCRIAVQRDGAKLIVIDPWNELEHKRRNDETLTEYVGRAIRAVKHFARTNNVAVWIVAHPTKPPKGTNAMPSLYDVSDSAHWSNKADYGLVYHRPDKTQNMANLAVVKVRMGLPGECCNVEVKLDHRCGRIRSLHA
ncbi:bifunctional DNA primase/helicase [Sphingomonas baiyangensis]|uniref:Toprim domain-containing protein n=1 Tax=Sphingomonas baiyangensis TaxID=2572576 RepID=A0A4U1L2F3_9SPHN|nr:bifunctional DNA primase/helicase [Sphingomonas baiyangensis]TKD50206.1 toprim domain-containing protein [Sphingomonas baiyangensis]